jgi:cytochrome o ubiquinol oxidase subunit III
MSDTTAIHPGAPGAVAPVEFYETKEHHPENGTLLGFWIYLMSDCLIFACLFAVYGVLGRNYAAGPSGADLFDLNEMNRNRTKAVLVWLAITGLFGLAFLGIEMYEFAHLIHEGATPQRSAFLSSFFALVGTHGLHVTFGVIWLVVLMVQVGKHGLIRENKRRLLCLSMFWHFLDVVWIGVFTFVYLMGVLP